MTKTEKVTHTPGPWKIDTDGTIIAPLGFSIPGTDGLPAYMAIARQVADCNAKLIAAAPELLEALEIALVTIERLVERHAAAGSHDGPYTIIFAAISKARGE